MVGFVDEVFILRVNSHRGRKSWRSLQFDQKPMSRRPSAHREVALCLELPPGHRNAPSDLEFPDLKRFVWVYLIYSSILRSLRHKTRKKIRLGALGPRLDTSRAMES